MNQIASTSTFRAPPAALDVEQSLLGSLIINNAGVHKEIAGVITAGDFYEPIHQRIFEVAVGLIEAKQAATPMTLATFLPPGEVAPDLDLKTYLARLCAVALPLHAKSYAIGIHELAVRRSLVAAAEELIAQASDLPISVRPHQVATNTIAALSDIVVGEVGVSTRRDTHASTATMLDRVEAITRGELKSLAVTTGFRDIDRVTGGGYKPGDLWIVGARPGVGKTVFAVASSTRCAKGGNGTLLLPLEVDEAQIGARILSDLTYDWDHPIPFSSIMAADVEAGEVKRLRRASVRLAEMPHVLDVSSRLSPAEIRMRIRAEKDRMARKGVRLCTIIIDYLKQVQASDRYKGNRVYEVGEITYSLKQIAKDEQVCIVLLAQLNRGLENREDKRPGLSDLRESGDLETDADVVALLHRQSMHTQRSADFQAGKTEAILQFENEKHDIDVILAKNRAGPETTVHLWCDVSCSTMADKARS